MVARILGWLRDRWHFTITFFPVQLFLLHLRRSYVLVLFWLLIFLFISSNLGLAYGFPYLFLTPEYLDEVNFLSYLIIGITSGLFVMSFHISSYIYYSYRYPFLATLNRPLWKFSLNNSIIPLVFYLAYSKYIYKILSSEGLGTLEIYLNIFSMLFGSFMAVTLCFTYFRTTLKTDTIEDGSGSPLKPLEKIIGKENRLESTDSSRSVINYYLKGLFSIKLTRPSAHYQRSKLLETMQQHHFSAAAFFVILVLLITALSFVSSYSFLMIPSGATLFLIFSLYLMITGAFYSRLKTWTLSIGLIALVVLNHLSGFNYLSTRNYAYGMDYETTPAEYSYAALDSITSDAIVEEDLELALMSLENWKAKQSGEGKPKLILINVSGGGLRSSLWTLKILQELDSATGGDFFNSAHLITGSSGGMLGAAYFRELYHRDKKGEHGQEVYSDVHQERLSSDLLNPTIFTLAVNDLFFRWNKVRRGGFRYPMDRGYSFDRELNKNTSYILDHNFGYYKQAEYDADIPTMIFGPTIVGDGRKLLMSTQGVSYLSFSRPFEQTGKNKEHDGVEFSRLFRNQSASDLSFITALRMSASFPYVTPLINMPSEPSIELIDAGVRDNEGFELALRFVSQFQEWIRKNTSGVLIVQMKANRPAQIAISEETITKMDQLTRPISGIVESFNNLQIYNKSLLMEWSRKSLDLDIDMVRFSLLEKQDNLSLSWHLTEKEKREIKNTFENPSNQESYRKVIELIGQ